MGLSVRKRRAVVATGTIIVVMLAIATVEAGLRIRHWIKYGSVSSEVIRFSIDPASGLRLPQSTANIRLNQFGFRSPDLDDSNRSERLRIAFLGGSTTFCAEATSNETTWPHLVWEKLQSAHPDVKMDYLNASAPGFATDTSLVNLNRRVAPFQPDIIVIYHATNDLSYDSRELAKRRGLFKTKPEQVSWLGQYSLAWFLIEKTFKIWKTQRSASDASTRLVIDPDSLAQGFRSRLRTLIEASQTVAPVVAVATFSHRFRKEQSPDEQLRAANTSLYYMPYMSVEGLLSAFEAYNRAIREVGRETNAIVIESAMAIPGDGEHFHDSVHLTDKGSQRMADVVADTMLHSEPFRRILALKKSSAGSAPDPKH